MPHKHIHSKRLNIEGIVSAIKEMDDKALAGFVLIGFETEDRKTKKYRIDMQKISPITAVGMLEEFKSQYFLKAHKSDSNEKKYL